MENSPINPKFPTGSVIIVSGPSKAGKSTLCSEIIRRCDDFCVTPPEGIHIYAQVNFHQFDGLKQGDKRIEVFDHFPHEVSNETKGHLLVFIDDVTAGITPKQIKMLEVLCLASAHHSKITCLISVHNYFYANLRTCRLSADFVILFANPMDSESINRVARQWYGMKWKEFLEIYEDAVSDPYGHLMFVATAYHKSKYRLLSKITENPCIVYAL